MIQRRASKLTHSHRRVCLERCEDLMLAEIGEERTFPSKGGHLRKNFKAEVTPLESAFSKIAPLGKGNGPSIIGEHRQRVTTHKILGQDIGSGEIKLMCFI